MTAAMLPDGFQTRRVTLRPIVPDDAEAIFSAYAQDARVTHFLTWRPHRSVEDTRRYIDFCLNTDGGRTYVLITRQDGVLCGAFDLRQPASHRLGFGYVLARPFWGQGLMTEVLSSVVQAALRRDTVWRIGDVCDIDNHASARVMEKSGLSREAVLRRWAIHPALGAEPRDCMLYGKVK